MINDERAVLIGEKLLTMGFRAWFKYMFRCVEGFDFKEEEIHRHLFECFQDIYDLKTIRQCIHIPPRAGKTTMAVYFVAYSLTLNPKCQFIYTSFSQSLLKSNAGLLRNIIESSVYKAMYRSINNIFDNLNEKPADDFWANFKDDKKKKDAEVLYSATIMTNIAGGRVLFNSIGSAITGYGVGLRNGGNQFDGCLIMDDPDKTQNINSVVLREKIHEYYANTLLSRLNKSNAPIVNIQQRLHLQDLGGFLAEKYKFNVLSIPLINEDGECLLPSQYTETRLSEIKINSHIFETQYQQNPMQNSGAVFKREWLQDINISDIAGILKRPTIIKIISIDAAIKESANADYTAILCFAYDISDGTLYLCDLIKKKIAMQELEELTAQTIVSFAPKLVIVEDKANGSPLLDKINKGKLINKNNNMPIITTAVGIKVLKSKVERAYMANVLLANKRFFVPTGVNWRVDFEKELLQFPDGQHDDCVDALTQCINYIEYDLNIARPVMNMI